MANYTVSVTLTGKDNLSPSLKKVNQELDNLEDSGKKASGGLGGLKDALLGLGAAFTVAEVAQKAVELYNLGTAANNAQNTFNQLSGGVDAAATNLIKLRSATGGVVDDMTLMAGANKLLMMQLVQTGDEAARMTELAVKLGGAMGAGAAESIDNFAAMLANRSIERLDSFGISSGKVREEVEKLKAAGMGIDEAFAFAVFEEGAKSLERIGAAAEGSGAALNRWTTDLTNRLQDFSQNFATAVNGIIGIVDIALGTSPIQAQADADAAARGEADAKEYLDAYRYYLWSAASDTGQGNDLEFFFENVDQTDFLKNSIAAAMEAVRNDPNLDLDQFLSTWFTQQGTPKDWAFTQMFADALGAAISVGGTSMSDKNVVTSQDAAKWGAYANYWKQIEASGALHSRDLTKIGQDTTAAARALAEYQEHQRDIVAAGGKYEKLMQEFAAAQADIDMMSGGGIGQYMARDTATAIQAEFESVQNQMQIMQSMFDEGLISEDQLNSAKDYAGAIKDMADEAGRAADALERASLSDIFGQSGGGRLGELTDNIVEQMRAAGKSDEEIAAVQAQLDMSSGRQTEASVAANAAYEKIAQLPPEQIAAATENLDKLLTWAASQNVDDKQLAWLIENRSGISSTGPGMQFSVNPGDTVSSLASMYNLSPEAIMQSTGITNPKLLQPGQYGAGESFAFNPIDFQSMGIPGLTGVDNEGTSAPEMMRETADAATDLSSSTLEISSNMETVNANTKEFVSSIQELAGKTTTVKINLDVDAGAFKAMLSQLGVNLDQVRSTRDNGGVVRGRDARVAE